MPGPDPPVSSPDLENPHWLKPRMGSKQADGKQGIAMWLRDPDGGLVVLSLPFLALKRKWQGERVTLTPANVQLTVLGARYLQDSPLDTAPAAPQQARGPFAPTYHTQRWRPE